MASLRNKLQDEEKEGEIEDEKRPKRQANQMQTCLDPNSIKKTTRRTYIVFTCFWRSTCHPHQQPVVCSQIHETTYLYLLYMETHTGYLTFPDGFSCLNIVDFPPVWCFSA